MQRNATRLTWAAAVLVAGGCRSEPQRDVLRRDVFLIKSSAANWGWGGGAEYGCCIASDGAVARYRYDRGSRRSAGAPLPAEAATAAELMAHYCPGAEVAGHATDIAGKHALLAKASTAPIQEQVVRVDAPGHSVEGYLLDPRSHQYREVVLVAGGDVRRVNPSPAAAELLLWSRNVLRQVGCSVP